MDWGIHNANCSDFRANGARRNLIPRGCAAVSAVAALMFASPASAQTERQLADACFGNAPQYTLQQEVDGCTGLIKAGQWTSENMAKVFNNRGAAFEDLKDFPRAIDDYSN